ncbi:alpha/beta fold hydrolase [Bacteroidota bacterium]
MLEPFQTRKSVSGQIDELFIFIQDQTKVPVILIGHSWGAWLAFIFTAKYPELVNKLILISAGAFEERYNADIMNVRMNHLSATDRAEVKNLLRTLGGQENDDDRGIFMKFGRLMAKADSYHPILEEDEVIEFQPDIFNAVWKEASEMRKSGVLIKTGTKIKCKTIAIHGDYDPHPVTGVLVPLSRIMDNFEFYELKKCGHYPWNEKYARDEFYKILDLEISNREIKI